MPKLPPLSVVRSLHLLGCAEREGDCLIYREGWCEATRSRVGIDGKKPIVTLSGYGTFAVHRLTYFAEYGCLPKSLYRSCGNRLCVNPAHAGSEQSRNGCPIQKRLAKSLPEGKNDSGNYFVYRLRCPLTSAIRYYGITCKPRLRFKVHCRPKTLASLQSWCDDLRSLGQLPVMELIAGPMLCSKAADIERAMIAKTRRVENNSLLNVQCSAHDAVVAEEPLLTVSVAALFTHAEGVLLESAAGDTPVATWARETLLRAAKRARG